MPQFEEVCAEAERAATAAAQASGALLRAAKAMTRAAQEGDIGKLRRAAEKVRTAAAAASEEARAAAASWPLSPTQEEQLLANGYEAELIAAGRARGLEIRRQDERLVSSPSLLRLLPAQRALQVDRRRTTALRPGRVVDLLKANQLRKPRFTPERFIETLHAAYALVAGRDGGSGVPLMSVYEALTVMPDVRRDYDRAAFSRDIFFLDRSGVTQTRQGERLSFPTATGTRSSSRLLSFVSPEGEYVTYYGIRFTPAEVRD